MKKEKRKIIKAWALLENGEPLYPLFYTLKELKEAKKAMFVDNIGKLEIKIIKIIPLE